MQALTIAFRYTAVTCDADDFPAENYTLRQKQLYEPTRKTEIFIVSTLNDERWHRLTRKLFDGQVITMYNVSLRSLPFAF